MPTRVKQDLLSYCFVVQDAAPVIEERFNRISVQPRAATGWWGSRGGICLRWHAGGLQNDKIMCVLYFVLFCPPLQRGPPWLWPRFSLCTQIEMATNLSLAPDCKMSLASPVISPSARNLQEPNCSCCRYSCSWDLMSQTWKSPFSQFLKN